MYSKNHKFNEPKTNVQSIVQRISFSTILNHNSNYSIIQNLVLKYSWDFKSPLQKLKLFIIKSKRLLQQKKIIFQSSHKSNFNRGKSNNLILKLIEIDYVNKNYTNWSFYKFNFSNGAVKKGNFCLVLSGIFRRCSWNDGLRQGFASDFNQNL